MTERRQSLPPPIATTSLSSFNNTLPVATREPLFAAESVEEEPYTIKCICDYQDDDGNTIYCEKCDTWQHIECFYHENAEEASREDFSHFCADCRPRTLDRRKATERQRQQREDRMLYDLSDKRSKRPQSKSHKKKPKPLEGQPNGYYYDNESGHGHKNGSPQETPTHTKKIKSGHRSHQSISSQTHKRSPSHTARIHGHNHPPSPATTPPELPEHFRCPTYSKQAHDLYVNDPGPQQLQTNSFATLNVTNDMSLWLRDPQKLREDAGVVDSRDVFQMVKPDFDFSGYRWPQLEVRSTEISDANDSILHLRYLSVAEPLRQKDSLVGELKGFVGFQKDYYAEETEGFARLCHPAPFVFFHPHLPLYIDTRREGSQCRYVRRSCRANTTLDTYITNKSEYHFCILNERSLSPNEQITIPWDFRFKAEIKDRYLHLLGLSDEDNTVEPDVTPSEYLELSDLITNVLADFGGCACNLGLDCAFARFYLHSIGKSQPQANGTRSKKVRKSKSHRSPIRAGQTAGSRDASESRQEQYDGEDDTRSTSGSVRSKPQSRDMTPFRQGSEAIGALTEQISEREKRKLVDIEKKFEMLDQAQPPRKKKRASDVALPNGNTLSTLTNQNAQKTKQKPASRQLISTSTHANGFNGRQYKDAGTSRQSSYSPADKTSPTAAGSPLSAQTLRQSSIARKSSQGTILGKDNYVDTCTQTDPVPDAWYSIAAQRSTSRKTIVPLGKRLLSNRHKLRAERDAKRLQRDQIVNMMDILKSQNEKPGLSDSQDVSPLDHQPNMSQALLIGDAKPPTTSVNGFSDEAIKDSDVVMTDISTTILGSISKRNAPPWSESAPPTPSTSIPILHGSSDMKIRMPPAPALSANSLTTPPTPNGSITPSSVPIATAQTPLGGHFPSAFSPSILHSIVGQTPSPVKKKLSLSDYKARMKKVPEAATKTEPESESPSFQPSSLTEDGRLPSVMEGSAILDSPSAEKEKISDPMASAVALVKEVIPTANGAL